MARKSFYDGIRIGPLVFLKWGRAVMYGRFELVAVWTCRRPGSINSSIVAVLARVSKCAPIDVGVGGLGVAVAAASSVSGCDRFGLGSGGRRTYS